MRWHPILLTAMILALGACGPDSSAQTGARTAEEPSGSKRIVLAFGRELDMAHYLGQGRPILHRLVNPGLSVLDDGERLHPVLAEAVPTRENGLWVIFPDGRMETTWTIRPGARWHDGEAFTTEDLLFTTQVGRDREVPILNGPVWAAVDEVSAADERTLTIRWKEPYIDADRMFSGGSTIPLPKHRLEAQYQESKADFPRLTYWLYDYVGTGPFRVRSWDPSNHAVLEANPDYILGRPKIDEIEVRFILDGNTLTASVLAGGIDIVTNIGSVDRARAIQDGWPAGQVVYQFDQAQGPWLHPQFVNPRPRVVAEAEFRRALLYGIDRQGMADTLGGGIAPVAYTILSPGQAKYQSIEAQVPHYDYDPRRAGQLLDGLGYSRGADGALRGPDGERLEIEIRSVPAESSANAAAAVAGAWQQIGLSVSTLRETPRLAQDPEAQATFPGIYIENSPKDLVALRQLRSTGARLLENNFQAAPANISRYMNPELDGLIDAYFRTIPEPERVGVLGRIIRHIGEQLPIMGTYHDGRPDAYANRLVNVTRRWIGGVTGTNPGWNAQEWDIQG